MASQKVEFKGPEGQRLSGVLETPDIDHRGWAVFAHCFTCSKASLASSRIARALAARGIGVLRFDFTGLGESEGDFSETGISSNVADLVAAANWMTTSGREVTLLIGHSLGGAASILAALQLPGVKALATLGAPSNAEHVVHQFKNSVPEIEARGEAEVQLGGRPFVMRKAFLDDVRSTRVSDAVQHLKRPYLVMHSPIDATVDIENATGLFLNARHPKSFVSLDNADHLLTKPADADFVADVISGWAQRYIGRGEIASAPPQTSDVIVRETRENGPYQNEVFVDGKRYVADEPVSVGGAGTGADPYALVTAGLGACTSMTLRMYADRKGWPLARVSVHLDHHKRHRDDCVECGPKDKIDVFTRQIHLEGDLDAEQREKLLDIADRCPVHRTLESVSKVETMAATISA
ncbi:MAG: bifunctional alpha/beta hydrolase/OsmC family protein [Pseudomonadota bacterium]